jgi:putative phage-type endonuclease
MNVVDCVQGDANWFKWRLGCVTSSRVADAVAKLKRKDGEAACRRDLRFELACELLTERASEHFVSRWMEEGKEREPLARAEYELQNGVYVEQVGFVCHPTIKMAGASPDGLIGEDGLVEIKCPKVETHLGYILGDAIPEQYLPQMVWQLACCERQWNDFVSYHPDLPDGLNLFVRRLKRTAEVEALIRGMELEVVQFLKEVDEMLERLKQQRKEALAQTAT